MDEKLNLARNWFKKADNDLKNAKIVIAADDPPNDTVCFHCQQTAEKYFKGYLVYQNQDFDKEHDLDYLIDLCCKVDPSFDSLRDIAENLSSYAVESRYPNDFFEEYSIEEAKDAIRNAESIKEFILGKITF